MADKERSDLRGPQAAPLLRGLGCQMRGPDTRQKLCEIPKYYSLPHPPHGVKVVRQIVDGIERLRQQLIRRIEVPQISPRVASANLARAGGIYRAFVGRKPRILDGQAPLGGEQQSV